MTDLVNQIKNQNVIYRIDRKTILVKGSAQCKNVYEIIKSETNKKDEVYTFPKIEKKDLDVGKNAEPLSIYNESINLLFRSIVSLIKDACVEYSLDYQKNKYYISSNLSEDQLTDFWYDTGGTSKPALFGIVSLDEAINKIFINEKEIDLVVGDIVVSEAGNKVVYSSQFRSLVFYVLPLSMIKNQYPQKWIPLI